MSMAGFFIEGRCRSNERDTFDSRSGQSGREYESTRHNVGFWWVDELAQAQKLSFKSESKFHGMTARGHLHGHEVLLLKPQTFMNVSGRAVGALAQFYKIAPAEIMVVHDELDLSPGWRA